MSQLIDTDQIIEFVVSVPLRGMGCETPRPGSITPIGFQRSNRRTPNLMVNKQI
ncbi:hypothetical protein H6F88_30360 [Oculatella sp. FACHB-28]|uniref:hypothetical protein n=1 Tax=Oculatella sp. FACHB-28 TaxID=2692845 RepID=UPI0016887D37|nr:hypothetical protein [Oculatella sp. FACHB-28]MBD2060251.1 hypothetical protein [Oculatella sp. FACHB-28]